ncbi:MAG: GNAT family N-acetyltransferase [Rhodobacteraceae bacterium]|nr:GNAT family N-acetyltransferase [Paracoccaceae bacterium]
MAPQQPIGAAVPNWTPPPWPQRQPIVGRYATLEPLDPDRHAAQLHRANGTGEALWTYLPYGPFPSAAQYHRWMRDVIATEDPVFYAIRNTQTGKCGGIISYLRITPQAGTIEIGHVNFSPELQRTRAASEAAMLMIGWAFSAGYRRVEWKCNALNMASRRAAQRLGLSFEGIFRQQAVVKGRNRDTAWFAAIDAEWPALQEAYAAWLAPSNFDAEEQQIERLGDLTGLVRVTSDPALG